MLGKCKNHKMWVLRVTFWKVIVMVGFEARAVTLLVSLQVLELRMLLTFSYD